MSQLVSLPTEIFLAILPELYPRDLVTIAATCRAADARVSTFLYPWLVRVYPHLLPWAAEYGYRHLVERLLQAGANPNISFRSKDSKHDNTPTDPIGALYDIYKHKRWRQTYEFELQGRDPEWLAAEKSSGKINHGDGWWFYNGQLGDYVEEKHRIPSFYIPPASYRPYNVEYGCDIEQPFDITKGPEFSKYYLNDNLRHKYHLLWFPLHVAAHNGHEDIIKLLIQYGAVLEVPSMGYCRCRHIGSPAVPEPRKHDDRLWSPTWTPLHFALCGRKEAAAKLLLSYGASLSVDLNMRKYHALHCASFHGCLAVVQNFVGNGIKTDIELRDDFNLTPLFHSYAGVEPNQVSQWLQERGASINADLGDGCTLLHAACFYGWFAIAPNILNLSMDVNSVWRRVPAPNKFERPLELVCGSLEDNSRSDHNRGHMRTEDKPNCREANRLRLARLLIERGADIQPSDCCEHSPIVNATALRSVPIVELLIENGVEVSQEDSSGYFPLMAACCHKFDTFYRFIRWQSDGREMIRCLIKNGAHPDQRGTLGRTALSTIAMYDSRLDKTKESLRIRAIELLRHAANPNIRDRNGMSPLVLAFRNKQFGFCRALVTHGAEMSPLHNDAQAMFLDLMKHSSKLDPYYLHGYHNPRLKSRPPSGPLAEYPQALRLLLDIDKDESVLRDPKSMHLATREPEFPFTEMLLDAGSPNLTGINKSGLTCVHNIIRISYDGRDDYDRLGLITKILERGFDVQLGHPIELAIWQSEWEAVKILLQFGAKIPWSLPEFLHGAENDALEQIVRFCKSGEILELALNALEEPVAVEALPFYLRQACLHRPCRDILLALIKRGADVNGADSHSHTPLYLLLEASGSSHCSSAGVRTFIDAMETLVHNGARLETSEGKSCLPTFRTLRDYTGNAKFRMQLARELKARCNVVWKSNGDGELCSLVFGPPYVDDEPAFDEGRYCDDTESDDDFYDHHNYEIDRNYPKRDWDRRSDDEW
jgi:ankyrin repeat protein